MNELKVYSVYSAESPEVLSAASAYSGQLTFSYPDLGREEALDVFPRQALAILSEVANECGGDDSCATAKLRNDHRFGETGSSGATPLVWKIVSGGRYVVSE